MTPSDSSHLNDVSSLAGLTLWTGGWDSTYRVLQRVLIERKPVRPVYVVDRDRGSAYMEVDAMNRLLLTLEADYPRAYALVEPPRYVDRRAILPNAAITEAWQQMKDAYDIGSQYDWLPRLADAADWTRVELSIYGGGRLRPMFGDYVSQVDAADGGTTYAVSDEAPEAVRLLFGRFSFPFWGTSKREAFAAAESAGLTPLLDDHTWFCFAPRDGRPCGACRPCQFMIKDGLGHRIPTVNRVRARAGRAVAEVRSQAKLGTRLRALRGRVGV